MGLSEADTRGKLIDSCPALPRVAWWSWWMPSSGHRLQVTMGPDGLQRLLPQSGILPSDMVRELLI